MVEFAGLRVLVVEDELIIAAALQEELEALGCRVVGPHPTVAEALAALDGEPVDRAVLDVNIRGEMVFPVAERLQAMGVPVVFCTGYAELNLIPAHLQSFPCLGKPCSGAKLTAALANMLRD